jgi:hypothetical protein
MTDDGESRERILQKDGGPPPRNAVGKCWICRDVTELPHGDVLCSDCLDTRRIAPELVRWHNT